MQQGRRRLTLELIWLITVVVAQMCVHRPTSRRPGSQCGTCGSALSGLKAVSGNHGKRSLQGCLAKCTPIYVHINDKLWMLANWMRLEASHARLKVARCSLTCAEAAGGEKDHLSGEIHLLVRRAGAGENKAAEGACSLVQMIQPRSGPLTDRPSA